jgi:hypothetical protein
MGFWGVELMARAGADPAGSAEVESWGGEEDWRYDGLNGWQIVRIHQADAPSPDQVLAACREIGGPLLVAYLMDSDCAAATCAEPQGEVFEFYVHPEVAVHGYGLPRMDAAQEAAPRRLVGWAGEGSGVDLVQVRAALATKFVFVDDALVQLAAALGAIPLSGARDLMFGDGEVTAR